MGKGSALDLNQHLKQMQMCMEKWKEDASPLLSGESCFPDLNTEKQPADDVLKSLFSEVGPELEAYTEMALELLCGQLLLTDIRTVLWTVLGDFRGIPRKPYHMLRKQT